ncbi:MAG: hypothetical protein ACU0C9_05510, partial [Paracoccaceae bacterium]
AVAYYGKLAIHPVALTDFDTFYERAAIGPISGEVVVSAGILFHSAWLVFAVVTWRLDLIYRRKGHSKMEVR